MTNSGKAIIAIVILLLLWGGTVYFRRGPIEQDLTARVTAAIDRPEFSNVAVSFDGREGTLSGKVDSRELKEDAEKLAHDYWGVRTIDNQLEVAAVSKSEAPAPETAALMGFQLGNKFLLTGTVPDDFTRSRVVQQAEEAFGNRNVEDQLSIRTGLRMPTGFNENYTQFLGSGRSTASGFVIENGVFTLKNTVPSELAGYMQEEKQPAELASVEDKTGLIVASVSSETVTSREDLQRELDKFLKLNAVEFDTASAVLTETSKKTLDQAAEMLIRFPEKRVEVQGHTDTIGQPGINMQLSTARAYAVYQYLIEKGVAADRLLAKGYGDRQPIADNSTKEGRQRNRRVAFHVQ